MTSRKTSDLVTTKSTTFEVIKCSFKLSFFSRNVLSLHNYSWKSSTYNLCSTCLQHVYLKMCGHPTTEQKLWKETAAEASFSTLKAWTITADATEFFLFREHMRIYVSASLCL